MSCRLAYWLIAMCSPTSVSAMTPVLTLLYTTTALLSLISLSPRPSAFVQAGLESAQCQTL